MVPPSCSELRKWPVSKHLYGSLLIISKMDPPIHAICIDSGKLYMYSWLVAGSYYVYWIIVVAGP